MSTSTLSAAQARFNRRMDRAVEDRVCAAVVARARHAVMPKTAPPADPAIPAND